MGSFPLLSKSKERELAVRMAETNCRLLQEIVSHDCSFRLLEKRMNECHPDQQEAEQIPCSRLTTLRRLRTLLLPQDRCVARQCNSSFQGIAPCVCTVLQDEIHSAVRQIKVTIEDVEFVISQMPVQELVQKNLSALLQEYRRIITQIVQANLRLVVKIAGRYAYPTIDILDLIQEGNAAMWKLAENYDCYRNTRFSSYVFRRIRDSMIHYLQDHGATIRVPALNPDRCSAEARSSDDYNPIPQQSVPRMDVATPLDSIVERHAVQPLDRCCDNEALEIVLAFIDHNFSEREQAIFRMRHGLQSSGAILSFEAIGKIYDVKWQAVQQIINRMMEQLGQYLHENYSELFEEGAPVSSPRRKRTPATSLPSDCLETGGMVTRKQLSQLLGDDAKVIRDWFSNHRSKVGNIRPGRDQYSLHAVLEFARAVRDSLQGRGQSADPWLRRIQKLESYLQGRQDSGKEQELAVA